MAARERNIGLLLLCVMAAAPVAHAQESDPVTWTLDSRLRWEGSDGAAFGPDGPPAQTVLLERLLLGLQTDPERPVSGYLQLGWHEAIDREGAAVSTDVNRWDIQQAHLTLAFDPAVSIRIGRLETPLGSSRLVGTRDSPNIRRSFDGAIATVQEGDWRVRGLALAPVVPEPGAFDDEPSQRERFYGVYATHADADRPREALDLYVLVLDRPGARFGGVRGDEERVTLGVRFAGARGVFDWDVEPMLQAGSFADQDIRAWTIASNFGVRGAIGALPVRWGLKANITSGDGDPNDSRLGTFNPLYPRLNYFNEGPSISPQNHIDLHPSLEIEVSETVRVHASVDLFWRTERADAIYRGPGVAVPGTETSDGRFVGALADLDVTWEPSPHWEIRGYISTWSPGAGLERAGAETSRFAMVSVSFRR